jgi:hypothetical protein
MTTTPEHFIPFRKKAIIEICCDDGKLSVEQQDDFRDFCQILEHHYHVSYYELSERLKTAYYPFNPDRDTQVHLQYSYEELEAFEQQLLHDLTETLTGANYQAVPREDIDRAVVERGLISLDIAINFDDFENFLVFKRGESIREEIKRSWFGLKKEPVSLTVFERVVIYFKFQDATYFEQHGRSLKQLHFQPGSTILKMFRNIPESDIEMLFPNATPQMSRLDKWLMGGVGLAAGIPVIIAKVLPALPIIVAVLFAYFSGQSIDQGKLMQAAIQGLVALGAVGGFLFKQYMSYKNKKLRFAKHLADNLYFRNLDNNAGVLHHLVDAAEEEECKEAILAYYVLLTAPHPLTAEALDAQVEQWFEQQYQVAFDFEVSDALNKLQVLGIGHCDDAGYWQVLSLDDARRQIDHIWDNRFDYANTQPESA